MRLYIIFGLTILLTGCASSMNNYYPQAVQSWRGGTANNLVKVWGRPDKVASSSNGNTYYVYETQNYRNTSASAYPAVGMHVSSTGRPVMTGGDMAAGNWNRGALSIACVAVFEANKSGQIVGTDIKGSNCYGSQGFAARMSNPGATVSGKQGT